MRLLAVVVLAAVAAGSALATPAGKGDPKKEIKPAVQARARAIAVRVTDLPGTNWNATPSQPDSFRPRCPYYRPDQSDLTVNGDFTSPDFERAADGAYVSSRVGIFVSTAQAITAYDRAVRPLLPRCLGETLGKSVTTAKTTIHSAGPLSLRHYGDRSAAYRVVIVLTNGSKRLEVTVDYVAVQKGSVDIAVIFGAIGALIPASFEQKVLGRVVGRV